MADVKQREQKLSELLIEIAKKHGYENSKLTLKPITSGGANYSSSLYIATVSAPNKEDLELFTKIITMTEETRAELPDLVHDIEGFTYNELAVKYNQMQEKCHIPEEEKFQFCKYYGFYLINNQETVVLENLVAKGFTVYDRMKSVDWPYASKAIKELAKFHALGMAYAEEYPEVCKERTEFFETFLEPAMGKMDSIIKNFVVTALKVIKEEYKDRVTAFFENKINLSYTYYTKTLRKPVFLHGDYRPSNIMHKENEDGTIQLIPLDYQTVRSGCMITDILYFIFLSSDEEFRAKHYKDLIELYYEQLCQTLRALNLNPEKQYPREDFEYELKTVLPYGLTMAVMLLPIITVEEENAPDTQKDNLFDNMTKTKTSNLYVERMNGVINDFARWGII